MILRIVALAAACLVAAPALAQRRDSTAMTCGQARAYVASRGAVVLGTGGNTYDRFVVDRRFCAATEEVRAAYVPTRETGACPVGYRCFEPGPFGWPGSRW